MVTTTLPSSSSSSLHSIYLFKLLNCYLNEFNHFSYSPPHPAGQGGEFEQEATWYLAVKCSLTKSSYAYATIFDSVTEWIVCANGDTENY